MLRSLSGRAHSVLTGVTIMCHAHHAIGDTASPPTSEPIIETFFTSTSVQFAALDEEVIQRYVESGEPFDKAGGYGYQSIAATFVTAINGCYYNVVGFPLYDLATHLKPHLDAILAQPAPSTAAAAPSDPIAASTSAPSSRSFEWSCCFCEKGASGFVGRNNPWPLRTGGDEDCCDDCNESKVITARLAMMHKHK